MIPIKQIIEETGSCLTLLKRASLFLPTVPKQYERIISQIFFIGYTSVPIVGILSCFIGAVLALQTGFSMKTIPGAQEYLGSIVGLSMCRELGPVMTAFLLAGRVGSAITAELASMTVYQEIDALKTMNISPDKILVMPRLLATALIMPILAMFSILMGWFGGMIVVEHVNFITIDTQIYWRSLKDFVDGESLSDGLIKAEVFGIVVALICCHQGLRTKGGPQQIGFSVTRAVVISMIFILILDYFVTKLLL